MKKYIRADIVDPRDENTYDLIHIIQDPNTRPTTLARFADHPEQQVRLYLAMCPRTPAEALAELAWDDDKYVRRAVAENLSTSADTLNRLARSHDTWVRIGVAANHNTPEETLHQLSKDVSDDVRNALIRNPSTPTDIKNSLVDTTVEDTEIVVFFNGSDYYDFNAATQYLTDAQTYRIRQDMYHDIENTISNILAKHGYESRVGYFDGADEEEYGYRDMYYAWCDLIISHRDQTTIEREIIEGMRKLGFISADCAADNTIEKEGA